MAAPARSTSAVLVRGLLFSADALHGLLAFLDAALRGLIRMLSFLVRVRHAGGVPRPRPSNLFRAHEPGYAVAMALLTRAVTAFARVGAALRRDRLLHPVGVVFDATLTVHAPAGGLPLAPGDHRALVRLSKATPTPAGWPDVLGLAVRVLADEDAGDATDRRPLDLALATTGLAIGVRHLLVPRRDFARAAFTSLLPYRVGEDLRLVGALPASEEPLVYTVVLAPVGGAWAPVATLTVGPPADTDVAFDVVRNALPGFRPAGRLNRLRGPVYRASQRARRRRV